MSEPIESEIKTADSAIPHSPEEALAGTPANFEARAAGGTETTTERSATRALNKLVVALKTGPNSVQRVIAGVGPAVGKQLKGAVYNGLYLVSFGATYSALTVASLVPVDSFVRTAVREGADAAKESFEKQSARSGSHPIDSTPEGVVPA